MSRLRLNPLTGLFDYDPVIPPDYVSSVGDTATIDLDVTLGVLTANLIGFGTLDTDDLNEGTTNLYFTTARARNSLSATSPIFYNSTTGDFSLGVVPISLGGTGQTNAQAAINNLSNNSSTAAEGDVFQWLAGNAQFAPYVAPGTTGTPNTLAYYNGLGNLINYNYWQAQDDGRISGSFNYTAGGQSFLNVAPTVTVTDTWNSANMISGTLNNNGVLTGFVSLLNLSYNLFSAISTEFINGINVGADGNVTNDKQLASFYSSGTVGNNYSGVNITSSDVVTGSSNFININRSNTTAGSLTILNAFVDTPADVTGNFSVISVGVNSDLANFGNGFSLNMAGDITKGFDLISGNFSGSIGDGTGVNLTGLTLSIQNTTVIDGGLFGLNLYNQGSIIGNNTLYGAFVNNQGTGYRYVGFSSSNNANQSEEIRGFQHVTNGDARTSTGLDIYMQDNATDDAQAIRISISNQTSTNNRVRSLDVTGATYTFNNNYTPLSGLFVDSGNNMFTEVLVNPGSPLTGTDSFINGNIIAFLAQDDVALGPVSLGFVHTSVVSLLAVAASKTVDLHRGLLVVASIQDPGTYTDTGTVTDYQGIVYAGALSGGGNTVISNAVGLLMPTGFDSYATANYGIRVQGATAENYLNKLAIGTATETAAAGLLLDVNGEVGVTSVGSGLSIAEGTNGRMGVATLAAGTVTVATTSVTASSRILLTTRTASATVGVLSIANVVAGTSFDIVSTDPAETSTVVYLIVEPI